jgi:hypothetical protein
MAPAREPFGLRHQRPTDFKRDQRLWIPTASKETLDPVGTLREEYRSVVVHHARLNVIDSYRAQSNWTGFESLAATTSNMPVPVTFGVRTDGLTVTPTNFKLPPAAVICFSFSKSSVTLSPSIR